MCGVVWVWVFAEIACYSCLLGTEIVRRRRIDGLSLYVWGGLGLGFS
jgi:hypothetical protein